MSFPRRGWQLLVTSHPGGNKASKSLTVSLKVTQRTRIRPESVGTESVGLLFFSATTKTATGVLRRVSLLPLKLPRGVRDPAGINFEGPAFSKMGDRPFAACSNKDPHQQRES